MVIPIIMHFLTFIRQRHSILHQTEAASATGNNYVNQSQAMPLMKAVIRRYIAEYPIRRRVTFASALECFRVDAVLSVCVPFPFSVLCRCGIRLYRYTAS